MKSDNFCLDCGTQLDYDIKEQIYICPKCGMRWHREQYYEEQSTGEKNRMEPINVAPPIKETKEQKPSKKVEIKITKQEGTDMPMQRGKCAGECGREDVKINEQGLCIKCNKSASKASKKEKGIKKHKKADIEPQQQSKPKVTDIEITNSKIHMSFDIEISVTNVKVEE
jgi:predicted RNA-binding Zn-ribbon protein involved in translation (DUF1610 family)